MLKLYGFGFVLLLSLYSCQSKDGGKNKISTTENKVPSATDTVPIFPVTDFLSGELSKIEESPVTPLLTTTQQGHSDSVWIKREDVRKLAAPFLTPVIDSASLSNDFKGTSFMDQTINAVTFTYSPKPAASHASDLSEIDVYINPQKNTVNRIYLVKDNGDSSTQLTWKPGQWFTIRTISNGAVTEKKVKWNFEE